MPCVLVRDAKTIKNRTFVSCQVASRELHIPPSKVYISETGTNTVPNTIPTAASFGTDGNGMAVKVTSFSHGSPPDWFNFRLTVIMIKNIFLQDACQTLYQRLEPIRNKNPKGSWESWVRFDKKEEGGLYVRTPAA